MNISIDLTSKTYRFEWGDDIFQVYANNIMDAKSLFLKKIEEILDDNITHMANKGQNSQ